MKLAIFALLTLSATLPFAAHAKTSVSLTCALKAGQDLAEMDGYQVLEGVDFSHGGPKTKTTLVSVTNGRATTKPAVLSGEIYTAESAEIKKDGVSYSILSSAGVDPREVEYAKSISISDGEPSAVLVNYFNKKDEMITGAIIVPTGGIQLCYPVNQ